MRPVVLACLPPLALAACAPAPIARPEGAAGFAPWASSAYVLPYAPGEAFRVAAANGAGDGDGHRGPSRFGYDFAMPTHTRVGVVRAGTVRHVVAGAGGLAVLRPDLDNAVVVVHADGSAALYGPFAPGTVRVAEGTPVAAGEALGLVGRTASAGGVPHLHVSVHGCDPVSRGVTACPAVPLTFRNTDPNPAGLVRGERYRARGAGGARP